MKKIKKNLHLIMQLTLSSFKLRNEGSYLGVLWYLLNPILMFSVLYVVFSSSLGASIPNYAMYTLLGLIQFNFLNLAAGSSMSNVIVNSQLIKSLNFNRFTLIISSCLMALINHVFELIVFFILLIILGISPVLIFLYPVIIVLQLLLTLGISLVLSSVMLYFRDMEHIWSFGSKIWWFATPIFYSLENSNSILYKFNMYNPMYYLINASREILIYGNLPPVLDMMALLGFSVGFFIVGWLVFSRLHHRFAELV